MVKGAHERFCHILATESALKFIRDAFCLALIAPFILKILKVSFWFFRKDKTQLHQKDKAHFKSYDPPIWKANCLISPEVKVITQ